MGTVLASGDLPALTRVLAAGYHGPPELTLTRAFTEWTFDPWMTALVVILGGSYLAGVHRVAGWPAARRAPGPRMLRRRAGSSPGRARPG